jgi:hypothetical protein
VARSDYSGTDDGVWTGLIAGAAGVGMWGPTFANTKKLLREGSLGIRLARSIYSRTTLNELCAKLYRDLRQRSIHGLSVRKRRRYNNRNHVATRRHTVHAALQHLKMLILTKPPAPQTSSTTTSNPANTPPPPASAPSNLP